ncbi:MAG: oxygen-independent coproporphyrinogen III oxidase [Bacteroidetes bacterium]|nr:oxygen-independent coproporphyrinogen III oxidase [Bacteroidota bacterium]
MNTLLSLLAKYNQEVPRYTSYPTVPYWHDFAETQTYLADFSERFSEHNTTEGISLYLHLPFCETLCTYCGCNKVITTNHSVENQYLQAIISEWQQYQNLMGEMPIIRELHLGGGTPTYFSPEHLKILLNSIFEVADFHPKKSFSIEGHPNNTTKQHLKMLQQFGFQRISFGVQDHNPEVQRIINRIQPYERVKQTTEWARESGFTSINYDLIYGLPLQTEKSIEKTIADTIALMPDRIAFYSYAHIPWKAKAQRLYDENDLPSPEQKIKFYALAREMFIAAGYKDIGMDHYALPNDELFTAYQDGSLHRNFMGYTTVHSHFLTGLGVSAISDTGTAYSQNEKKLSQYYQQVNNGTIPIQKGYILNEAEIEFKQYILDIACKGKTKLLAKQKELLDKYVLPDLSELKKDGIVFFENDEVSVTETGRIFLRNICHAFDIKKKTSELNTASHRFSKAV